MVQREASDYSGASAFWVSELRKTNVYIDGFNFYYGSVKGTRYKWLDFSKLFSLLLPPGKNSINRIRYFTALVRPRPSDPQQALRQQIFLRALRTIPNLTIHLGTFLSNPRRMQSTKPPPNTVEVLYTEEKGSDVNLATYLIFDGIEKDYEVAAVVSNDSDLVEPIRLVREKLGLPVGIINPHKNPSRELVKVASFYKQVRDGALRASQFPDQLRDAAGVITKPSDW